MTTNKGATKSPTRRARASVDFDGGDPSVVGCAASSVFIPQNPWGGAGDPGPDQSQQCESCEAAERGGRISFCYRATRVFPRP